MPDHPYLTLGFAIILSGACLLGLRLGIAEKVYEPLKESAFAWYWLRVFNVPVARENCVRLVRISLYLLILFWLAGSTLNVAYNG